MFLSRTLSCFPDSIKYHNGCVCAPHAQKMPFTIIHSVFTSVVATRILAVLIIVKRMSPVIKYLVPTGRKISKWFKYVDQFIMPVFASVAGAKFSFENYNDIDGSCVFTFKK